MRTNRSTDVTVLRSEIAASLDGFGGATVADNFEERCRASLQALRWPEGVECPRCDESTRLLWLESRSKWHCYSCRYQFSVTAGTLFHSSHLPVWKWFVAVHLMLDSPEGVSANELRRVIGGSYKTAWFAAHRIRLAMRGRGAELLRNLIDAEARHASDAAVALDQLADQVAGSTEAAIGFTREQQDVMTRMRRALAGPHHQLSNKYLSAYIDERRWRSANRENPHVFRDTILALLHGEGTSYEQLVATR